MKRSLTFLTFILVLSLSSCVLNTKNEKNESAEELVPVSINNEFSMSIPSFMTKATSLHQEASLQFQNGYKETYVIVINEEKQDFIDAYIDLETYDTARSVVSNYADLHLQYTTSTIEVISKNDVASLEINGLDAATTEIDARVEGVKVPITYFFTFVEGREKLYMIMAWTLQDRKDNYRATFERMARSFKML